MTAPEAQCPVCETWFTHEDLRSAYFNHGTIDGDGITFQCHTCDTPLRVDVHLEPEFRDLRKA